MDNSEDMTYCDHHVRKTCCLWVAIIGSWSWEKSLSGLMKLQLQHDLFFEVKAFAIDKGMGGREKKER